MTVGRTLGQWHGRKMVILLSLCWVTGVVATARQLPAIMPEAPDKILDAEENKNNMPGDEEFKRLVETSASCADGPSGVALTKKTTEEDDGSLVNLGSSRVEKTWASARVKTRDINDITLCTQLDENRLHMLLGQCQSWGGPLSAIVYMPLVETLDSLERFDAIAQMISKIDELHKEAERQGWCTLDIALLLELRPQDKLWSYPYNSNRNQAIARAKTRLILLLDVDFLPSDGIRDYIRDPKVWKHAMMATQEKKEVWVLPAFETGKSLGMKEGNRMALAAASASKYTLQSLFENEDIVRFAPFFDRGHGPTNYSKWFGSADEWYEIIPELGYEPFILMSRLHVPWFDERFRGYGWDKIVHIYHLAKSGFHFMAFPSGWVVHRPHAPSAAYSKTFTGPAYSKKHKPTEELRKLDIIARKMMGDVKKGIYPEHGVSTLQSCNVDVLKTQLHSTAR